MYQLKFPEFLGWMDSAPNEQMNPFPIANLLIPVMYYDLSVSDLWLLILIQINLMKQTLRWTHSASPRGVCLRENQLHFIKILFFVAPTLLFVFFFVKTFAFCKVKNNAHNIVKSSAFPQILKLTRIIMNT